MKTLVLDLATVLGFCFGNEVDGPVEHGAFKLPSTGEDIGAFLYAYRNWLTRGIAAYGPERIVFEAPILLSQTNIATLRKLYSLAGITELVARDNGIICDEANLSDIRTHFIGVPRAPMSVKCKETCRTRRCSRCKNTRRDWTKGQVISKCRAAGFRPEDDNDADALALFSFVMSARHPNFVFAGNEIARAA